MKEEKSIIHENINKQENLFGEVRNWMYRNARPLDLARWRFHFEQGSITDVLKALAAYQNDDGGFGHALEADAWNPNSSPIQTFRAIEMLKEVNFSDKDHPIIQGLLSYLDSGSEFNGKVWRNAIPSNDLYPHAPWWHSESESSSHTDYNPTAGLAGFALYFANPGSRLYQHCSRITKEAVDAFYLEKESNMHTLICYITLYEYCEQANITDIFSLTEFREELEKRVKAAITKDTSIWASSYVCKPSQFIQSPESIFYSENKEIVEYECEFIMNTRNKEGVWNITWSWAGFPEEWAISKNWWIGNAAISNVLYLQRFKKI